MGLLNIIQRMHLRQKLSIHEIARLTGVSRSKVSKHLATNTTEPRRAVFERQSKIDPFAKKQAAWWWTEAGKARKQRLTVKHFLLIVPLALNYQLRLHAGLLVLGFTGAFARVAVFSRMSHARKQSRREFFRQFERWTAGVNGSNRVAGRLYSKAFLMRA